MIVALDRKRETFRRRPSRPGAGQIVALGLAALAPAGCSISMPLPSLVDNEPTGSVKPGAAALSGLYDWRDWRVAQPALAASLRAPGPAEPAAWSNAETGGHGEFVPVAGVFARQGQSCRAFVARLVAGKDAKTLQAVGCLDDSGEVAVYDVARWTGL
jgi:hypothetical protein